MKPILTMSFAILIHCTVYSQLNTELKYSSIRSYDTQKYRTKDKLEHDEASVSMYNKHVEDIERKIKDAEKETIIKPLSIQVIFHLLHSNDIELTKNQIHDQLDALNRDFNNKSLIENHPNDIDGTFYKLARDAKINFILKEGSIPTTETDAVYIPSPTWQSWDDMKQVTKGGVSSESPDRCINIWVSNLPSGMASYATSIYRDVGSDLEGIVLDAKYFNQDATSQYNQGKTLTHLMGNYLGLYDLWDDKRHCQDDYVDDTPIHNSSNFGKPAHKHITTCPEENYAPEMLMNFMDNSDDELQTMFTAGQVLRMHTILNLFRQGLIND